MLDYRQLCCIIFKTGIPWLTDRECTYLKSELREKESKEEPEKQEKQTEESNKCSPLKKKKRVIKKEGTTDILSNFESFDLSFSSLQNVRLFWKHRETLTLVMGASVSQVNLLTDQILYKCFQENLITSETDSNHLWVYWSKEIRQISYWKFSIHLK